jgi:hypothetical protein
MSGDILQNMAPNAKRSCFVTLVFGAVAAVIYLFGVQPSCTQRSKNRENLENLEAQQTRMNSNLRRADLVNKDLNETLAKLKPYNESLLTPLLESYAMRAKSILDPFALGAGLVDVNYADEAFRALPLTSPAPRQLHTRAAVKMTATGSYQEAISFLLRLEKELPMTSVQSFAIVAQQDPEAQKVSFVIEWPAMGGLTRK